MSDKFQIGDKVALKEGYKFKSQQVGVGVIFSVGSDGWLNVRWENGNENGYEEKGVVILKGYKPKAPTHVVIWEEESDPARLFTSEKEAKDFVKELSDKPSVKQDSILLIEIKSCKKVGVTKSLRYNQHKI